VDVFEKGISGEFIPKRLTVSQGFAQYRIYDSYHSSFGFIGVILALKKEDRLWQK
jgi:hypothetical protein